MVVVVAGLALNPPNPADVPKPVVFVLGAPKPPNKLGAEEVAVVGKEPKPPKPDELVVAVVPKLLNPVDEVAAGVAPNPPAVPKPKVDPGVPNVDVLVAGVPNPAAGAPNPPLVPKVGACVAGLPNPPRAGADVAGVPNPKEGVPNPPMKIKIGSHILQSINTRNYNTL